MKQIFSAAFLAALLLSGSVAKAQATGKQLDKLTINQVQVLGTHNSYARPVDTAVLAAADPIFEKMMGGYFNNMPPEQIARFKEYHPNSMKMSEGLKYSHPPFDVQLDSGLRSLELDVYYDPTGNRFIKPASYALLQKQGITNLAPYDTTGLSQPGFKLMHIADYDFRTHYPTLQKGLQVLKNWSDQHPSHFPIYVMVEAKDKGMPIFPNPAQVLPFDAKAFDELDAEIIKVLGRDKLITPDDVRGEYKTLKEAVLAKNWPTVAKARGKFIFLLLPSAAGLDTATSVYAKGRTSLQNRVMFLESTGKEPFAAFLLLDNAIVRQKEIQQFVKDGYIVRSRADIETYEAKVNDLTRAKAAFSSGAQVISTDFFRPGNGYGTSYVVRLPNSNGEARPNPVNAKK